MILILCRVVDHFGDAGVCLRLSRGLIARGERVALVTDRRELIAQMLPARAEGLAVYDWPTSEGGWPSLLQGIGPIDRLVESFQVEVPDALLVALSQQPTPVDRILLDYLATEPWADGLQGLPSPDPRHPLAHRRWMAPSFSAGGLGLVAGDWHLAAPEERLAARQDLLCRAGRSGLDPRSAFLVLGFGYPDAPWDAWAEAVRAHGLPAGRSDLVLWHPQGLELTQAEFDLALQATDLNIVRGEDSFVAAHRAAATPWAPLLIWMPYRQEAQGHRAKLAGWTQQLLVHPSLNQLNRMQWAFNQLPMTEEDQSPPALGASWARLADDWDTARGQFQRVCRRVLARQSLEESILSSVAQSTS